MQARLGFLLKVHSLDAARNGCVRKHSLHEIHDGLLVCNEQYKREMGVIHEKWTVFSIFIWTSILAIYVDQWIEVILNMLNIRARRWRVDTLKLSHIYYSCRDNQQNQQSKRNPTRRSYQTWTEESVKIPSLKCRKMSKPGNGKADHGTLP